MNLALLYVWEDARARAQWNHSFDVHLNYLGPVSCFSSSTQQKQCHSVVKSLSFPSPCHPSLLALVQGLSWERKTGDKCPFPFRVSLVRCKDPSTLEVLAIVQAGRWWRGLGTCVFSLGRAARWGKPGQQEAPNRRPKEQLSWLHCYL